MVSKLNRHAANSSFDLHPSTFNLHPSSFILLPSTFNLHPSTFILHPSSFILSSEPCAGGAVRNARKTCELSFFHMSKDTTLENENCSCGAGCGDSDASCCCPLGGEPGKTLAFWVLRAWLGARALFTGFSKWHSEEVSAGKDVAGLNIEDYGSVLANKAAEAAGTGAAADAANVQLAAKGAKDVAALAADAAQKAQEALAAAGAKGDAAFQSAVDSVKSAIEATNQAVSAANAANKAVTGVLEAAQKAAAGADGAAGAAAGTTKLVHHGLPQAGDWTLAGFLNADVWYMPAWALKLFDATLGYVLIALGVTLLLGIGTRLSLFLQGLLYTGLTLGFIAISKEPGSSAGITMLGVHIVAVVAALALAKYNKLAVCKKF
ncbi:MAG: hypothetical protein LBR07_09165 [Puniceicoccales bacterium]|jgi:hypothetical protein|nr:hypothetical protein [Puniceicoccales bacterium]